MGGCWSEGRGGGEETKDGEVRLPRWERCCSCCYRGTDPYMSIVEVSDCEGDMTDTPLLQRLAKQRKEQQTPKNPRPIDSDASTDSLPSSPFYEAGENTSTDRPTEASKRPQKRRRKLSTGAVHSDVIPRRTSQDTPSSFSSSSSALSSSSSSSALSSSSSSLLSSSSSSSPHRRSALMPPSAHLSPNELLLGQYIILLPLSSRTFVCQSTRRSNLNDSSRKLKQMAGMGMAQSDGVAVSGSVGGGGAPAETVHREGSGNGDDVIKIPSETSMATSSLLPSDDEKGNAHTDIPHAVVDSGRPLSCASSSNASGSTSDMSVKISRDAIVAKLLSGVDIDDDFTSARLLSVLTDMSRLQQLSHPSILSLQAAKRYKDSLYLFLDHFPSSIPLTAAFENRHLTYKIFRSILLQISDGLEYLHENGVVHRSLRCHNILIDTNNVVKIRNIQLSPAKYRSEEAVAASSLRPWMAPEVCHLQPCTFASDMWAFACLILEVLAMRSLSVSDDGSYSKADVLTLASQRHPILTVSDCGYVLECVVDRCLVVDQDRRMSAAEMKVAIQNSPL